MKTYEDIRELIESGTHNVVMFITHDDLPNGVNFFMAVLPKKGSQWHRDIIPAVKRYLRAQGHQVGSLSAGDGQTTEDVMKALVSEKIPYLWTIFVKRPEGKGGDLVEAVAS
jgi:hypothetical protein